MTKSRRIAALGGAALRLLTEPERPSGKQRLHDPPGLLDAVLPREAQAVAGHRGLESHLVEGRALAALLGEIHVSRGRPAIAERRGNPRDWTRPPRRSPRR